MSSTLTLGHSSSSKKRALVAAAECDYDDDTNDKGPPVRRSRTVATAVSTTTPPSQSDSLESRLAPFHVKALQQQLDHERSLRALDSKKAQQTQQRLERQVQFAVDEANEYKAMLSEFQQETEKHTAELQADRNKTLEELRDCQYRLNQLKEMATLQHSLAQEKQAKTLLERQLDARSKQIDSLRDEIDALKKHLKETLSRKETSPDVNLKEGALSPAPKDILRELNEVRIQLAESQRQYRQLQRATQSWHDQAKLYVKEREIARSATARVISLEEQMRQSQSSFERLHAERAAWKEFSTALRQQLQLDQQSEGDATLGGPPEAATVMRHLKVSHQRLRDVQEENSNLKRRLEKSDHELNSIRKLVQETEAKEEHWERERKKLQQELDFSKREVQTMQAKEAIWKREGDSLRALMQTYEDFPSQIASSSAPSFSKTVVAAGGGPRVSSMELNIASLQEELKLVQEEKSRLADDRKSIAVERDGLQQEQDRLQTRLARIQAALLTERQKAQEAEERACKFEALAGKGAFNPEESRALHLKRNPFTEALQAKYESEIQALRKQLADGTGAGRMEEGAESDSLNSSTMTSATTPVGTSQLDPGKLHQRLKDTFTEHAALFREAVYLITGYKVDMVPGRARPTFRVRSVYGEQEHDELVFVWPKKDKDGAINLDLMDTPFAKVLSTTDSYQYMTKFKSLPAFMACVQLSLFDKTTLVIS